VGDGPHRIDHGRGPANATVDRAISFARDVVEPSAERWEREGATAPREIVDQAAEAGLCGLRAPRELGGEALDATATARVVEELASADHGAAFVLVVHNNAVGIVAAHGSEDQVSRYVPDLIAGRKVGAFLLTEPAGGSDAAALTTTATPQGDGGWVLDGEKSWITSASCADVLNTYAQTDSALGWRGIAAFLVDGDQPGVVRDAPYPKLGVGAAGTGGFRFDGCRLAPEQAFVPPGRAFKVALAGIDLARLLVAAMACGMLRRGLEEAVTSTTARRAFGRRLADFQGLQWQLADVATDLYAARSATYRAAAALDGQVGDDRGSHGVPAEGWPQPSIAAAHAKKFATRAALRGLAACMQALGANGLRRDLGHPLARHLAAAKVAEYLDGTTEIQNVVISRALYGPG
jgi:alkylation response protein AidB-like acyl-CoA dehydrogenase